MEIRRLGSSDLPLMRDLNRMFGRVFEDPAAYDAAPPQDAYLQKALAQDHVFVLAAMDGDRLAGGLVAYALDKLEQARSEIYIYDLAVEEAWRRKGVATRLINHLQKLAVERGAWVIFVQADHGDDPAVALYEKLGVREDVMHFDIPVK